VKPKPRRLKSKKTATDPITDRNEQCRAFTKKNKSCIRAAQPASQYCHQHQSWINSIPTHMTGTPEVRETVQCSGISKGYNRLCQSRVVVTPGWPKDDPAYCRHHLPKTVASASDRELNVRRVGREDVFVPSCGIVRCYPCWTLFDRLSVFIPPYVKDIWKKVVKSTGKYFRSGESKKAISMRENGTILSNP
jgi:hypothetical protein